jgi:hypothetical protein
MSTIGAAHHHAGAAAAVAAAATTSTAVSATAAPAIAAGALLLAAFFKSSQFPMTGIFARSMEGPTPASALGYGGLSAHFGVVLLAANTDIWFGFEWARALLGATGAVTACTSMLASLIRSDRKGSIAYATSATVGVIFVVLAAGYTNVALTMCLGNAAFRVTQILRAPSALADAAQLKAALRHPPWHCVPPAWLYRLAWATRRFESDFHLMHPLHVIMGRFARYARMVPRLNQWQQWAMTAVVVVLAGFPFSPLAEYWEHYLIAEFQTNPLWAAILSLAHFGFAVIAIRLLFVNVLNERRFAAMQRPKRH